VPFVCVIDRRSNVQVVMDARLKRELQLGLFRKYLGLTASEMTQAVTHYSFQYARAIYLNDNTMSLLTNNIDMLREVTSILARLAALSSLTNPRSWPILAIALAIPGIDQLYRMMPWQNQSYPRRAPVNSADI
jgi:hypothetical protein